MTQKQNANNEAFIISHAVSKIRNKMGLRCQR